jgi:hypothetical protein
MSSIALIIVVLSVMTNVAAIVGATIAFSPEHLRANVRVRRVRR